MPEPGEWMLVLGGINPMIVWGWDTKILPQEVFNRLRYGKIQDDARIYPSRKDAFLDLIEVTNVEGGN